MDLQQVPAIDTHCHPFDPQQDEIGAQMLRDALSVSLRDKTDRVNESSLLSRITIRHLANLLDCPATWEAVIEERNRRARLDNGAYLKLLWEDANIQSLLIDPGFPLAPTITRDAFAEAVPCDVFEGYRIERFFPDDSFHSPEHPTLPGLVEAFRDHLDTEARRPETRFFKTVIAYRTGLSIRKVSESEANDAWNQHETYGDEADKVIRDFLFWEAALKAAEHELPFQVHTGHTSHVNLWPNVNPILLTPLLNDPDMRHTEFVLVHGGYPYCTEAGYLTSVYPNIMLDLSLMIPWSSIGIARRIEETLEAAPTDKVMYGSDGIWVPELYWISAKLVRKALGSVLDRLVSDDVLGSDDAVDVAESILYRNASSFYKLA